MLAALPHIDIYDRWGLFYRIWLTALSQYCPFSFLSRKRYVYLYVYVYARQNSMVAWKIGCRSSIYQLVFSIQKLLLERAVLPLRIPISILPIRALFIFHFFWPSQIVLLLHIYKVFFSPFFATTFIHCYSNSFFFAKDNRRVTVDHYADCECIINYSG